MKVYSALICITAAFCLSCADKKESPAEVIATVGERIITCDEFRQFYGLDPNFAIDSVGLPALTDELYNLINQLIALKKAEAEKLTQDSIFMAAVNWERRQAMLRQLFREVVSSQIIITEDELRQAYLKNSSQLHVRHLFSKDRQQAEEWHDKLLQGEAFSKLARQAFSDSILAEAGGDLGWVKAGDLDDDFAAAALNLNAGEISLPIQTRWGYHIIQMLDRKDQIIVTESEFIQQKISLEKKIHRQKSQALAGEYVKSYMKKYNPQPFLPMFRLLWQAALPPRDSDNSGQPVRITFTNDLLEKARQQMSDRLDIPLIYYNGGKITLKSYLDAIRTMPVSHRPSFRSVSELSEQMSIWTRDQFLYQEAQQRSLDRHEQVRAEVRRFAEEQSYFYYLNSILDSMQAPDEIISYFREGKHEIRLHEKFPELRRCHTLQEWQWRQAERVLRANLRQIKMDIKIDQKILEQENRRINWQQSIRMFMVRKPS